MKAPAKIDSFSLKTAIRKCFLSCENKVDRVFFRKIIIERNFPSRIKTLKTFANSTPCFLHETIDRVVSN